MFKLQKQWRNVYYLSHLEQSKERNVPGHDKLLGWWDLKLYFNHWIYLQINPFLQTLQKSKKIYFLFFLFQVFCRSNSAIQNINKKKVIVLQKLLVILYKISNIWKMSGSINKSVSSGPMGPSTADLLCNSHPFGTGFSTAVSTADSGTCFLKTGAGPGEQQFLLKPFASFHCYDTGGHLPFFQPQNMDWQIHHSSEWMWETNKTNKNQSVKFFLTLLTRKSCLSKL